MSAASDAAIDRFATLLRTRLPSQDVDIITRALSDNFACERIEATHFVAAELLRHGLHEAAFVTNVIAKGMLAEQKASQDERASEALVSRIVR